MDKFELSRLDYRFLEVIQDAIKQGDQKHDGDHYKRSADPRVIQYCNKIARHLLAFMSGEDYDNDDGQHHLGAIGANAQIALFLSEERPMQDDRPGKPGEPAGWGTPVQVIDEAIEPMPTFGLGRPKTADELGG